LLDSIGIASIYALLVVSCTPVVIYEPDKLLPTLFGFTALGLYFYRSKSIIFSTLIGAVSFGITLKLLIILANVSSIHESHFFEPISNILQLTDK